MGSGGQALEKKRSSFQSAEMEPGIERNEKKGSSHSQETGVGQIIMNGDRKVHLPQQAAISEPSAMCSKHRCVDPPPQLSPTRAHGP